MEEGEGRESEFEVYAPFGGIGGRRLSKKKNLFPAVEKENFRRFLIFIFIFIFWKKAKMFNLC